ncbi:MAG: sigma-54 dependent transcriptional regulator [Spirochaetales bacterium]|uniref:Sigma-54 dependent transcriptional regulator n=1 Tax=Candidatus Thalassospirochaeta sargassi TaxID=3119039 RepID=A0AAJ1MJ67_9SPIO|nr:sigma-54 dependent transcriptional regulator [Spirochaetales bacterium]
MSRILILDDNQKILDTLSRNFSTEGIECRTASNIKEALDALQCCPIDLALVDVRIGDENGIDALKEIKQLTPELPVMMITGFATIETAVEAIKIGANEYIKKPIKFSELLEMVAPYIAEKPAEVPAIPNMQTRNPRMISLIKKALKLAQSNLSVLILGESGTGKEVFADIIYHHSQRSEKQFLRVNCAAFPDTLLDNELFGHEKGAYTGATDRFQGVFERADKGTLFLDELGDMPLPIQAKILRAIQEHEIRRLGGKDIINIDVRFIGATNHDLEKMVADKTFRGDLYYRLNCAALTLPPLRERKEDIPLLAEYFINQLTIQNGSRPIKIAPEAMEKLISYDWPGNIRELKTAVTYGATICADDVIYPDDLPIKSGSTETQPPSASKLSPRQAVEKELYLRILAKHDYNKKKTAEELGVSRTTLYSKMSKYGINEQ